MDNHYEKKVVINNTAVNHYVKINSIFSNK